MPPRAAGDEPDDVRPTRASRFTPAIAARRVARSAQENRRRITWNEDGVPTEPDDRSVITGRVALAGARNVGETLSRAASDAPSREAVVCGEERADYASLDRAARRVAGGLRLLGVGDGERVAVWLPNGVAWAAAFYGAARVGTCVPLNVRYRAEELETILAHSSARVLIVDGERQREIVASVAPGLPELRSITTVAELGAAGGTDDHAAGGAPALVQYTSGTTARPKGVVLGHEQVLRNAWELGARLDVRPGDRYASGMPFHHVGGSVLTLLLCAAREATAVTLPRFEAEEMLAAIERERCTHFFGIETMCVLLLERAELDAIDRSALRVAFVGGRRAVLEAVRERLCPVIVNRYGLTESSGNTCCTAVTDPPEVALDTMGRPLPGLELRIVDGEIRIRGWAVTAGYLDDADATRAAFDDEGWLRTGDRGEIDADGRLRFLGRAREMLRVGGENVSAAEIEELVGRHPAVAQVAVVAVEDERLGEVPVAFVELRAGRTADEDELVAFCRERAAGFKTPRRVHLVAPGAWPLTGSGKIRKTALRDEALAAERRA